MYKLAVSVLITALAIIWSTSVVQAQEYVVSLEVHGEPITLTVSVEDGNITVESNSRNVDVTEVNQVNVDDQLNAETTNDFRSTALTIEYDDLFRYNEDHIGKVVQYVGQILQVQEIECATCEEPSYILRIAITEEQFGSWDDVVWVEYESSERFLDEDIVTFWGTVEGLKKYTTVLGNIITIPQIKALDIELGRGSSTSPSHTGNATEVKNPTASRGANLRQGPSTSYPIIGGVKTGETLVILARNEDASWYQLESGAWIASFLVNNPPSTNNVPIAEVVPSPQPTEAPAVEQQDDNNSNDAHSSSSSIVNIGDNLNGLGWSFKVTEVHKRKAVYFYDNSYVAMNNYLVIIIDAVNQQSGTDYFANNLNVYITDSAGNVYHDTKKASRFAQWQYGGLSSEYSDVNPGSLARIALAFDIPENIGEVMLSTDLPAWVKLGNFSTMEREDK